MKRPIPKAISNVDIRTFLYKKSDNLNILTLHSKMQRSLLVDVLSIAAGPVLDECLGYLQVVVESSQVQRREAIFLGLVDAVPSRHVLEHHSQCPHVPPQGGMVKGTEPVVIGHCDVRSPIKKEGHQIIPLLGYCIMKGRVPFRVLKTGVTVASQ